MNTFNEKKIAVSSRRQCARWIFLGMVIGAVYLFGISVGPWITTSLPILNSFIQVVEEHDIDTGAYYYTETKEMDVAQQYVVQAVSESVPGEGTFSWPVLAGLTTSLLICFIGFWVVIR